MEKSIFSFSSSVVTTLSYCYLPQIGSSAPSLQADDIRALLMDAMPPDALPSCFKPQATVVSASVISPASTPSCLSAASSIDNLAGPLTELAAAAAAGSSGVADGAAGGDRKEGECTFVALIVLITCRFTKLLDFYKENVLEDLTACLFCFFHSGDAGHEYKSVPEESGLGAPEGHL